MTIMKKMKPLIIEEQRRNQVKIFEMIDSNISNKKKKLKNERRRSKRNLKKNLRFECQNLTLK